MSRVYKVITNRTINWQQLVKTLQQFGDEVRCVDNNPHYYFYHQLLSARGVDITLKEYGIEISVAACSNAADYLLANNIATTIKELTDAIFKDEEDNEINIGKLFRNAAIAENTWNDIETLKALLARSNEIVINGPHRPFHIQRVFAKKIHELSGNKNDIAYQFSKLLLRCQYPPEEFATGKNFMSVTTQQNNQYMVQGFYNSHSMILENVKAISLGDNNKTGLMIEPNHLVQFLPPSWELLDEFTIAARVLPGDEWDAFYQSMIPFQSFLK